MDLNQSNQNRLEEQILQNMDKYLVPSMSLAVVNERDIIYSGCFGLRDPQKGLPPDLHTRYAIGSVTKSMTSVCLGILKEQGKVGWDEPVIKYLPEFRMYDSHATLHTTLKDLLTHMTGLPRHDRVWYSKNRLEKTTQELVKSLEWLKPNKDFRSSFEYSNLGYTAASAVIERISGMPWHRFLYENLFQPLDMKESSGVHSGIAESENKAVPYFLEDACHAAPIDYLNFDGLAGAGTVNSTVSDMAKYLSMHIGKGRFGNNILLSEKTMNQLHWTHAIDLGIPEYRVEEMPVACYGLGWTIQPYRGHLCIQHSGKINGFSSYATFLPFHKIGIILLCNLESSFLPVTTAHHIYDMLLKLPAIDWEARYAADFQRGLEGLKCHNQKILSLRSPGIPPLELSLYAGTYSHPGYGEACVRLSGGGLCLEHNGFIWKLNHSNFNTFDFDISPSCIEEYQTARFVQGEDGTVKALCLSFEPGLNESIEFNTVLI